MLHAVSPVPPHLLHLACGIGMGHCTAQHSALEVQGMGCMWCSGLTSCAALQHWVQPKHYTQCTAQANLTCHGHNEPWGQHLPGVVRELDLAPQALHRRLLLVQTRDHPSDTDPAYGLDEFEFTTPAVGNTVGILL